MPSEPVVSVVETDTIVMEYFNLAYVSLAHRFLYRFLEPVGTIWVEASIPVSLTGTNGIDTAMKDFALTEWKKMIATAYDGSPGPGRELPPECEWMLEVDKVTLHPCEIVRLEE